MAQVGRLQDESVHPVPLNDHGQILQHGCFAELLARLQVVRFARFLEVPLGQPHTPNVTESTLPIFGKGWDFGGKIEHNTEGAFVKIVPTIRSSTCEQAPKHSEIKFGLNCPQEKKKANYNFQTIGFYLGQSEAI